MRPAQALDIHAALTQVTTDVRMLRYLTSLGEEQLRGERRQRVYQAGEAVHNHLRAAYTYHVSAEIMGLVRGTAERYLGTETLGKVPPPTPCGIMVLDEPLRIVEHRGRNTFAHMLTWGPSQFATSSSSPRHTGLLIVMWNDANREPDDISRELLTGVTGLDESERRELASFTGGFMPVQIMPYLHDTRIGPQAYPMGQGDRDRILGEGDTPVEELENIGRLILAIYDLMNQTVAGRRQLDMHEIDRKIRRRAERARLQPRVTVITLRRQTGGHTGSGTPLDHRVPVRGHWRNQPYGSRTNPEYRRIWINDHIKGPAGTPIHYTDHVYDLKR